MLGNLKCHFRVLTGLLLMSAAVYASDIYIYSPSTITGGGCVVGTCPPPNGTGDALQYGGSIGPTSGGTTITFGDGDAYSVSWTFSAAYNAQGTFLSIDPVVTYIGSSPSVGTDVLNIRYTQNYYSTVGSGWDGSYGETVILDFGGAVGAGSSAQGELFYSVPGQSKQGVGLCGPYSSGTNTCQNTANLSGLSGNGSTTLRAEYDFQYTFDAGTQQGAGIGEVPEPTQAWPIGLSLAALTGFSLFNRRSVRLKASEL